MRAFVWDPALPSDPTDIIGAVLVQEVALEGRYRLHKGHRVTSEDLSAFKALNHSVHLVSLAATDVHEDEAGSRLARAIVGTGIRLSEPRQSRVNAIADVKGLLRIDQNRLRRINCLPNTGVFTLPDRMAVIPGRITAGIKITPVAIDEAILAEAEAIGTEAPIIQVKPFKPLRVGAVTTESLAGRARDRFRDTVRTKIGWYGGEVLGFEDLPSDSTEVAAALERFVADGAELILTGGGNTIDPLDPALLALPEIGVEMVKFGAPAHPGSMFWLAYRGPVAIFNLASCSMFSRATSADLILPWIMAGERVTTADVADLGLGGLLEGKEMAYRFPPYDREAAESSTED